MDASGAATASVRSTASNPTGLERPRQPAGAHGRGRRGIPERGLERLRDLLDHRRGEVVVRLRGERGRLPRERRDHLAPLPGELAELGAVELLPAPRAWMPRARANCSSSAARCRASRFTPHAAGEGLRSSCTRAASSLSAESFTSRTFALRAAVNSAGASA